MEVGKSKIKVLANSAYGESLLPVSQMVSFCCVLTWQKGQENSLGIFYKGTDHIHEGSALMT